MNSKQTELAIEAIARSMHFEDIAQTIVEPDFNGNYEAEEAYHEFIENDISNWASWIANVFPGFASVARTVAEEGY